MNEIAGTGPHFVKATPEGDNRVRDVCGSCGFIDYKNPKIVVGSVLSFEGEVLLCRRAIEPRKGFWTLPAGYLELEETAEAGAIREAFEEACVRPTLDRLLAVYSVPRLSQVQLMFRGRLASRAVAPGVESLDARLFSYDEIPWDEIAFPSARWALRHWKETLGRDDFAPFSNPAEAGE